VFFKKYDNKIPLETVQNLYEIVARRIMGVLKAEGGPTKY
jgi:hypothetical protein